MSHRPVTVLMLLVSIGVIGYIAFQRIPLQLAPPGIVEPQISLWVPVEESTPQDVLEQVTKPVEESLRTIAGISNIYSRSTTNGSSVRVAYDSSVDGDAIYADIRDRMERILPSLPEGADRYRIFRFNLDTDMPVMWVAVTHTEEVKFPDTLLENVVQARLEGVPGVARVDVRGLIARRVDVELDPEQIRAYGVDVSDLIQRLRGDNVVAPGGVLREGGQRYLLRLSSRFTSFDEIRDYRINDSLVLGDIATVGYRRAVKDFLVRVDQELSYMMTISKQSDANTVEVCDRLEEMFENELPKDVRLEGFRFYPFMSQGRMIRASISSLKETCIWGGLFAVLILFLFLRRVRVTFVVAAAIPLSLMIAVVVIFFRGGTFNIMSLTGLTLAIGMLIDNAIVIAENIYRLRQSGVAATKAAIQGTRQVSLAIVLATLTTVAVFLPLIFLGGDSTLRLLMGELGLPVCYALLASLFAAIVFIPLATVYLGGSVKVGPTNGKSSFWIRTYGRLLHWTLNHRFATFVLACLLLSSQGGAQSLMKDGGEDRRVGEVQLEIDCEPTFSLIETDAIMKGLQKTVAPLYEELGVQTSACWYDSGGGTLAFFMKPDSQTTRAEFTEKIKPHLPTIAGVEIGLEMGDEEQQNESEIWIEARGRDPMVLESLLRQVAARLNGIDGILDVTTVSTRESGDEIQVQLLRERAQRFNVNPADVAMVLGWALRGAPLSDYETPEGEIPFWIQFKGSDMENIGDLYGIEVYSQDGNPVSLVNLATFSAAKALPSIHRRDGRVRQWMQVVTESNVDRQKLRLFVRSLFNDLDVPDGYEVVLREGNREREFQAAFQAMALGLVLIFVLMGVLFESFWLPLSAATCIPFLFVGAFWMMYFLNESMSEVAYIGFVILLGIVVNNAIVLVDCINRVRRELSVGALMLFSAARDTGIPIEVLTKAASDEFGRKPAILAAGKMRLRPILMTACTTICGLLPLVFIPYEGQGLDYRPLSVVVLGGLIVSTLVTVFVVPLAYTICDDLSRAMWRPLSRLTRR